MHERNSLHKKVWNDKRIYPTYEPYPVSLDFENQYCIEGNDSEDKPAINNHGKNIEESFFVDSYLPIGFSQWHET